MDLLSGLAERPAGGPGRHRTGKSSSATGAASLPTTPPSRRTPWSSRRAATRSCEVLRFANERGIPVVPFGQGSSLEGHTIPCDGGISLDLGLMDEILEVRPEDFVARVEPGVTHGKLNASLEGARALLPGGPGLGRLPGRDGRDERERHERGALRGDAGPGPGPRGRARRRDGDAHRRDGDEVVGRLQPDRALRRLGGNSGRLHGADPPALPGPRAGASPRGPSSPDIEAAGRAAVAMIRSGMQIGRVELVDARTVEAVNAYKGTDYAVAPTLFLEFSGSEASVEGDVATARSHLRGREGADGSSSRRTRRRGRGCGRPGTRRRSP